MGMYAPGSLEQVRQESIRRLDGGGLPVLAERRLAERRLAAAGTTASSPWCIHPPG
jgi:hypothetical protein